MIEEDLRDEVDAATAEWRQGDFTLGQHWFLFRFDRERPLTSPAVEASEQDVDAGELQCAGLMVVTQTCDIVRTCVDRPFVEVCPLIEVSADVFREVARGYRPQYATASGLEDQGLVADLDLVMTVEKTALIDWPRMPGCLDSQDRRGLTIALARKRSRVAFPDEFAEYVDGLRRRISAKHDKNSPEGRALRALREIRVRAAPSWESDEIQVTFFFVRSSQEVVFEGRSWDSHLERWLNLLPESNQFMAHGLVVPLEDMSAQEYVESDPLDLDHLSSRPD